MVVTTLNIKAVTFDLWETLLLERSGDNSRRMLARCKNLSKILTRFGEVSENQIGLALKEMALWLISIWETNKDVTHLDQIRFIIKASGKGSVEIEEELINELSSAYVAPLFEIPPYLNPEAPRVLKWLKERNKLTGIICNTGRTPGFSIRRFLEKEGVAKYFNIMLFSDEIGIRKPDLKIFQIATKKLNVKPHQIIHIGDNLKSDVWGAKNAGMKAVYFSTEMGKDTIAESDPNSLVSYSRKLGNLKEKDIIPDRTIPFLGMIVEAIENFENNL